MVVYGLRLQVRFRVRFALATKEFTYGLVLASKTEDRYLAMIHLRMCVYAAKRSVSSLDHHDGVRILGYQKKKLWWYKWGLQPSDVFYSTISRNFLIYAEFEYPLYFFVFKTSMKTSIIWTTNTYTLHVNNWWR